MIFYFTGIGNSLRTVKALASELQTETKNIVSCRAEAEVKTNDAIVGFVFPTYLGDLPWIAKEFLLKLKISADACCFLVMTSSQGKSGKAFDNLHTALASQGAVLSAGFDLQMPGNCVPSSEKANAERFKQAPSRIEEIAEKARQRCTNYSCLKPVASQLNICRKNVSLRDTFS